jgi:hypothetical protein
LLQSECVFAQPFPMLKAIKLTCGPRIDGWALVQTLSSVEKCSVMISCLTTYFPGLMSWGMVAYDTFWFWFKTSVAHVLLSGSSPSSAILKKFSSCRFAFAKSPSYRARYVTIGPLWLNSHGLHMKVRLLPARAWPMSAGAVGCLLQVMSGDRWSVTAKRPPEDCLCEKAIRLAPSLSSWMLDIASQREPVVLGSCSYVFQDGYLFQLVRCFISFDLQTCCLTVYCQLR